MPRTTGRLLFDVTRISLSDTIAQVSCVVFFIRQTKHTAMTSSRKFCLDEVDQWPSDNTELKKKFSSKVLSYLFYFIYRSLDSLRVNQVRIEVLVWRQHHTLLRPWWWTSYLYWNLYLFITVTGRQQRVFVGCSVEHARYVHCRLVLCLLFVCRSSACLLFKMWYWWTAH